MMPQQEVRQAASTFDADSDTPLAMDTVFDLLADRRRRCTLYYLDECTYAVGLSELAEQVAAFEQDVAPDDVTAEDRERVLASLRHSHVPDLVASRIVAYDPESDMATLDDPPERLLQALELAAAVESPW